MHDNFLTLSLQSISALAVVLGLFAAVVWMLKRLQQHRLVRASTEQMRAMQSVAIDAKHSVVELARGNTRYLIGISPSGMTAIAEYDAPEEADPPLP